MLCMEFLISELQLQLDARENNARFQVFVSQHLCQAPLLLRLGDDEIGNHVGTQWEMKVEAPTISVIPANWLF